MDIPDAQKKIVARLEELQALTAAQQKRLEDAKQEEEAVEKEARTKIEESRDIIAKHKGKDEMDV